MHASPRSPGANRSLRIIRTWVIVFIVGLALSGITAFPLEHEVDLLVRLSSFFHLPTHLPALNAWIVRVANALHDTNARYPFLAYGTDWLAFGHLVIATAFIGALQDPVRNKWLFTFGLIACAGVLPLAFIAGPLRGIPVYWRCIDSAFGLFGCIPLLLCLRHVRLLEAEQGTR